MKKTVMASIGIAAILLLGITGCATKSSVQKTVQPETEQLAITSWEGTATVQELEPCTTLEGVLVRAETVGKDKFSEATESDGLVLFKFDSYELSAKAKAALDTFAVALKGANNHFFIELQGHTDDFGTDDYNFQLGLARARAAMGYLYTRHGIPLQLMNGFSCGESKPVADNTNSGGRAQNRRVTLVLIQ